MTSLERAKAKVEALEKVADTCTEELAKVKSVIISAKATLDTMEKTADKSAGAVIRNYGKTLDRLVKVLEDKGV